MATSGTTAFTLDFTEIAEEAWERAGGEMRSGYDLRTARRSMNLLTIEWQNRGINLWTIDEGSVSLVADTAEYSLPADTVDILDAVVRTGSGTTQSDITINRISASVWSSIPNKLITGRPIQFWIERLLTTPSINVWPVPNNNDYTFYYWRIRRIEDAGNGVETPDMNFRFFPALVAGLAYYLAMKVPGLANRVPIMQAEYERQFMLAAEEDRNKVSVRFVPRIARV
jgi:hypothetical protein|tara:strand:- start:3072 stop:3752 length:681 start_codon:yes stop_codon:yes gene_type:complete